MSYNWYWPHGGWDVEKWKAAHPWQPIHSEQSNHLELLPVLPAGADRERWEVDRRRWRTISDGILGELTDRPPASVKWEYLSDPITFGAAPEQAREEAQDQPERGGGDPPVVMRKLRFKLTDDEWGYAWLLTPRDGRASPRAAVVALHQTVMQGKNEPVGLEGQPGYPTGMDYGLLCARRGFAVLAPDAIAFGERAGEHSNAKYRTADAFFTAHPNGSVMGKMMFDVSRAIDLLEQLPDVVDRDRIGCIGHSHGGYGAIFAMIGDERLKAGAVSCGFTTLRTDPKPERWWRRTALMPRLGFYEGRIEQVPLDFHIWLSLIAPRPLFLSVGLKDAIFPRTDNVPRVLEMLRPIWGLYGAAEQLRARVYPGPHDFPSDSREQAISLLRDALMPAPR
jgi:dienelactone hydrolase